MKALNGQRIREERGVVLIVAMLVLTVLSVLGLAFLMTAQTEDAIASNYRNHTAAFYAAEAGVESGVVSLRSLLGANPNATDVQLAAIVPPALTDPGYTFNAFQVRRVRPTPYPTTIDSGAFTGLNGFTTAYEISATATGPRASRARLTQRVNYVQIPLFQFMAFYGKGIDLETYAGPEFWVTGRVHANSSIYLADNKANGMHFESTITATGNFYRRHKDEVARRPEGNPDVKDAGGTPRFLDFDHEVKNISSDGSTWTASDENYWRQEALNRFGGKLLDSAHGVQEITPPIPDLFNNPSNPDVVSHQMIEKADVGDSQALKDAKLYYKADLIIEGTKAYDQAGNEVKINDCKDSKGKKAVRKETFYDGREKREMEVTQVDVGALTACGVMPKNGILYVSADNGKPEKDEGVRLVNGAELPKQGLTVVSENPVYIQGDYNTKNKVPAAVLADAVTVLSNNWKNNDSDKKGDRNVHERPASKTTVNAALATGPDRESSIGYSNGQLNNLIRFLEDWNGVDFNYKGSLVALWHSQHAQGSFWCCDDSDKDYYWPPNRIWSYETLFNTNPPPGTPMGIIVTRGQWSEG
jgi:Tfp pilus assembly protein PilX